MEDEQIVALYWERSETAIRETAAKYEKYCYSIAFGILKNREDAQESVNDTYLDAWNSMPPHRPFLLSTFLGKITRRVSIDRWRRYTAKKRGGGEMALLLSELTECVPAERTVERDWELSELARTVNEFLLSLPEEKQRVFLCRYWYADSVASIAKRTGFSQSKVKSMLYHSRKALREHLDKEGF